jgi:2-desacetyl-2-hydroxyethyl bacteriochlorophyllide A dehydrogenase
MTLDTKFDQAPKGSGPQGSMRAVRITEAHVIDIIETAIPGIGADDVLVRPTACGICGTDLHILHHGFPGTNYPVTPGHEFAGHVVAVGPAVRGVKEGDFVAVDPNVVCGHCKWCRAGRPNLCLHLQPIGVGRPGAAAEFVSVPAGNAFRVREGLGGGVAALIEPLACVMNAVEQSGGVKDRDVLVFGAGTMGLLIAIVCQASGAGRVTIADPVLAKHAMARAAGIERAVTPADLGGEVFDVVFEAAGVRRALEAAFDATDKTGTLVQVGVHDADATVPLNPFLIYEREIRIVGSNSLGNKFAAAVEFMPQIQAQAATLIGDSYPVWDFSAAVDAMAAGRAVKTQLSFT